MILIYPYVHKLKKTLFCKRVAGLTMSSVVTKTLVHISKETLQEGASRLGSAFIPCQVRNCQVWTYNFLPKKELYGLIVFFKFKLLNDLTIDYRLKSDVWKQFIDLDWNYHR